MTAAEIAALPMMSAQYEREIEVQQDTLDQSIARVEGALLAVLALMIVVCGVAFGLFWVVRLMPMLLDMLGAWL